MSLTLLDTNVLVYAFFAQRPEHKAALALLEKAQEDSAGLCVAPQNLAEFYAVTTNPRRVTTPLSSPGALEEVGKLCALPGLLVLPVPTDLVSRWRELLERYPVTGRAFYDVQLVATMLGNGITRVYTYDRKDFERFAEVEVVSPEGA